jgi:hypothetical protein
MFIWVTRLVILTAIFMALPWYTEPDFTMTPGLDPTIIQGPGHGDSISAITPGLDGVLDSDIVMAGLTRDSDTIGVAGMVAGGDLPSIILPIADGAVAIIHTEGIMAEEQETLR